MSHYARLIGSHVSPDPGFSTRYKISREFLREILKLLCTLNVALLFAAQGAVADVPEPEGYRMELYDDLVPAGLEGATAITAAELKSLQAQFRIVVVDVIPEHRRPDFLPENQIWIPLPHLGVPGALWLPDVGFGSLSETTENYFKHHLQEATGGDKSVALAFYCRADCWMSWNAAKRALTYGYTTIYWFYDGIDDWKFEGFETENLTPAPGKRHAED